MWFLIVSIPDHCNLTYFVDMNMFARFDKIPAMTFQDIKETKRYKRKHNSQEARNYGQHENSISTTNSLWEYHKIHGLPVIILITSEVLSIVLAGGWEAATDIKLILF